MVSSYPNLQYLLDTNLVSEPTKPEPCLSVLNKLHLNENSMAIPALVIHELLYGYLKMPEGQRKRAIAEYLKTVVTLLPVLNYDEKSARIHAEIRADLQTQGLSLPFVDGQIAAIAIANGLILVTRNTQDFQRIPGIRLENWFSKKD